MSRPSDRAIAEAFWELADMATADCVAIRDRARELDASGGGAVDYTAIANRAQEITGRSIYPSTVKAILEVASPADDAGVRVEAAAEALAKMIIRQEALTMKTPEAAMHHMAHWRRAIEEGRDLLATLNRVAAEAAASTQEGG